MLIRSGAYTELFGTKAVTVAFTTFVGGAAAGADARLGAGGAGQRAARDRAVFLFREP